MDLRKYATKLVAFDKKTMFSNASTTTDKNYINHSSRFDTIKSARNLNSLPPMNFATVNGLVRTYIVFVYQKRKRYLYIYIYIYGPKF